MANAQESKDFKESLKTTSLFGGVQIYNIIIQIIRSKFVAVLLGPAGMGITGLLTSTTYLIGTATNLGLGTSAVRELSQAYSSGDNSKFNRVLSLFRKLVWITGSFGMLVCLLFSPLWSNLSFGNKEYTWAFCAISITLLFGQLSSGQGCVFQSTRHFKYSAKSNVIGSTLGLLTTVPLYYFFGVDGIVPVIIIASLVSLILSTYYSRKIPYEKVELSWKETFSEGRGMAKMGFFVAIQGFIVILNAYIMRIYISNTGSLEDVGLYNAAFAIIDMYVGMIFTAMGTEYYPRLSSYSNDTKKFSEAINTQMIISSLLAAPLIAIFLLLGTLGVILLYSTKFLPITVMLNFMILGVIFKAPSWCLGFAFLAKGDTKAFFFNELAPAIYNTIIRITFYSFWGLTGVGIAYLVGYFLYLIQVYFVCKIRYQYKLHLNVLKFILPQTCILIAIFLIAILNNWIKYLVGTPIVLLCFYLSYKQLNHFIDVKSFILNKIKR